MKYLLGFALTVLFSAGLPLLSNLLGINKDWKN